MRVEPSAFDTKYDRQRLAEFEDVLKQPTDHDVRPCPGCQLRCPDCGSTTCTCHCSNRCPQAGRALSSEPEQFPIEPGILPLVYALTCLRLCRPCWSCEGHAEEVTGTFTKLPRVWFHAATIVYPILLAQHLARLSHQRRIESRWQVSALDWGARAEATFAIAPKDSADTTRHLQSLRRDILAIADRLPLHTMDLARENIAELSSARRPTE